MKLKHFEGEIKELLQRGDQKYILKAILKYVLKMRSMHFEGQILKNRLEDEIKNTF